MNNLGQEHGCLSGWAGDQADLEAGMARNQPTQQLDQGQQFLGAKPGVKQDIGESFLTEDRL